MGLLAQLEQVDRKDPRMRCGVDEWLRSLDDVDRDAFEDRMKMARAREGGWNMAVLHRVALANGLECGSDKLRVHARGDCSCGTR